MSATDHKCSSILLCRKRSIPFNELNFLFQLACHYAQKGFLVFIIVKEVIDRNASINYGSYLSKPDVLQRIFFRYFSDSSEILQWCHEMHRRLKLPRLFLVSGLETFVPPNEFTAIELCAALIDSAQYCSITSRMPSYILVSVMVDANEPYPAHLVTTLFDGAWSIESSLPDSIVACCFHPRAPGVPSQTVDLSEMNNVFAMDHTVNLFDCK